MHRKLSYSFISLPFSQWAENLVLYSSLNTSYQLSYFSSLVSIDDICGFFIIFILLWCQISMLNIAKCPKLEVTVGKIAAICKQEAQVSDSSECFVCNVTSTSPSLLTSDCSCMPTNNCPLSIILCWHITAFPGILLSISQPSISGMAKMLLHISD